MAVSKSTIATIAAGLGLLIPASLGLLVTNVPTILCPFPLITILSAFLLHSQGGFKAAVAVPTLLFFGWHPGLLFRGDARIPTRSYVLLIILILLSIAAFIAGWNWALQYQGAHYTCVVCAVNIAWAAFLAVAFARTWKKPSSFAPVPALDIVRLARLVRVSVPRRVALVSAPRTFCAAAA
jgi:hypothetical protein